MKALSLWQPWASLMADGRKKIETRHWSPPAWLLGEAVAIHATMRVDSDACQRFGYDPLTIPRGCIVAIARLLTYEKFTDRTSLQMFARGEEEVDYGDFSMGRYGWRFLLLEKLNPPIAAKGHQGIWECELIVNRYAAQREI